MTLINIRNTSIIKAEMEVRTEYELDTEATIAVIVDDESSVPIIDQCVKICEENEKICDTDQSEKLKGEIVNANFNSSPFHPNFDFDEEQRSEAEDNKDTKLDTLMSTFLAQSEFDFDAIDCCDDILYTPAVSRTESWDDTYAMMLAEVDHNTGPERKLFINIDNICDATVSTDTVDAIKTACEAITVAESPPLSIAMNLQVGDDSLCIIDSGTYTNIMTLSKDDGAPETRITAAYESVTSNCDRPGIGEDVPLSAATDETEYGDTYDSDYCFKTDSSELKIESGEDAEIGVNPHFMQDENLFSTSNEFGAADANETSSSMLGNVDECEYRSTTVSMHFLSTDSSISTNSMALDGLTDDLLAQNDFEVIEVPVENSCTQLDRATFEDDVAYAGERLNMDVGVATYEAADIILSTISSGKCKTAKDSAVDTANHSETAEREYGTFYIYDPLVAEDTIQFRSHIPSKGMDRVAWHAVDGAASITVCAIQDHLSPIICSPINDNSPANEIENSLKINTFAKRLDYLLSVDKLNSPKKVQDDDLISNEGTVKKSATNVKSALIVDDITIQKTKLAYESIVLEESEVMYTRSKTEASSSPPLQISSMSAHKDGPSTDLKKNQEVGFPSAPAHSMVSVEDFCTISIAESTIDSPGRLRIGDHLLSNAQDVNRNVKSNISLFKRLFGKKDTATEEKNFKPACCAGVLSAGSCYSTFSEESIGSGPKRTSTVSGNSMLSTEDSDEGFLEV